MIAEEERTEEIKAQKHIIWELRPVGQGGGRKKVHEPNMKDDFHFFLKKGLEFGDFFDQRKKGLLHFGGRRKSKVWRKKILLFSFLTDFLLAKLGSSSYILYNQEGTK